MAKIDDLSHELILYILEHLRVQEIALLCLLSKDWSSFVQTYSSAIYRSAAILHGFVQHGQSLSDSKKHISDSSVWLDDVETWRDLCTRLASPLLIASYLGYKGRPAVHRGRSMLEFLFAKKAKRAVCRDRE